MRKLYKIGDGSVTVGNEAVRDLATTILSRLRDTDHADYYASDRELAIKYKLKVPMVKKFRKAGGIPIKEDRILRVLRMLPTETMFIDGIVIALKRKVSYNTLYVLMRNNNIPFQRKNKLTRHV